MNPGLVDLHDLEQLRRRMPVVLVDLRAKREYLHRHIPGAISCPYEELMREPGRLPRQGALVFYCSKGNLSFRAALHFSARGYRAYSLKGGWPERGF